MRDKLKQREVGQDGGSGGAGDDGGDDGGVRDCGGGGEKGGWVGWRER